MTSNAGIAATLLGGGGTTQPPPTIPSIEVFLFSEPLYAKHSITENWPEVTRVLHERMIKLDAFCPGCSDRTTYSRTDDPCDRANEITSRSKLTKLIHDSVTFRCARHEVHFVTFWLRLSGYEDTIEKVGQYPSLADIANDEAKRFRKLLSNDNAAELHKAIGLAAHGVGIGSFVYLRRVFERLIHSRFADHRDAEGWTEEDWQRLRMDERVQLMKAHLPEFLVTNSSVYGILSKGVHELDEQTCLAVFEVVKESIIEILEEDERKRQRVERQQKLTKAIQEIGGKLKG